MLRIFLFSVFCLAAQFAFSFDERAEEAFFLSRPEQVATSSDEPQFLVGGVVNPLSGQPSLRKIDLIIRGAQELTLSRTYMSPHMPVQLAYTEQSREEWEKYRLYHYLAANYKGWQFYPHLKLIFSPETKQILVTDPNGCTLGFSFKGPRMTKATFEGKSYGISNCAGESPSGAFDPRNTRVVYDQKSSQIIVYGIDQVERFYRFEKYEPKGTILYLLEKERLPNGKILRYHYTKGEPVRVESLAPNEQFVYASLTIEGNPWKGNTFFSSSSGQEAEYVFERRPLHVHVKERTEGWFKDSKFEMERRYLCPPILSEVRSPNFRKERFGYCDRFLLTSYEDKDQHFQSVNGGYGKDPYHYRVHWLLKPDVESGDFSVVYEMSYDPPVAGRKGGTTTVHSSDGTSTVYHFSKQLLMTKIEFFGAEGDLKKEKLLSWDDRNWLQSVDIRYGQGQLFSRRSFEYDRFGNPILETFTGDLSGSGEIESTWTKRSFSDDGKNLLLSEAREDGSTTVWSYLEGTSLAASKLIKDGDEIILREFWKYDESHNLIEKRSDNGNSKDPCNMSGATESHEITYSLRQSAPFLHMPEKESITSFGTLLRERHLVYDEYGNVTREDIDDALGKRAFSIHRTYNERGDLLTETDRLGQTSAYSYDENGHCISASSTSNRRQKKMSYDLRGRLSLVEEEGVEGACHRESSKYDMHDRLIETNDYFGNSTQLTYDPCVNKVCQTDFPKICGLDGHPLDVVTVSTYDPFGRETSFTDPNGKITTYTYNVRGSVSGIHHPNGGIETFRYAKNGDLVSKTDPDGLRVDYEYDILRRPLKKSYLSEDGHFLGEETFAYNSFHLTSETDKEGHLRHYFYDSAGRKIREEFCGRVTEFGYDSLGRLRTITKYNGTDALVVHYERDVEDRIVSKKKTDLSGQVLSKIKHSYDDDGNRETISRFINGKEAIERFSYDAFKRPIFYQDAAGFEFHTYYDETYSNPLGQNVMQVTSVDPKGCALIKTFDALRHVVREEKISNEGAPLFCQENWRDPAGNVIVHKDHIYEGGKFQSTQTVRYFYTDSHQIGRMIRGFGTENERETLYTHAPSGKLKGKILPDGTVLTFSYHPLGSLSRIDSSDQKISYSFAYNALGDLTEAYDENKDLKIKRTVDSFGNVIAEVFPFGLSIEKDYDDFDRPVSLNLFKHGQVRYEYDPLFLREIIREAPQGQEVYRHTFVDYDLDGNLIKEQPIGSLGFVSYTRDQRGRLTRLNSPAFSETCDYDSIGNLIRHVTNGEQSQYEYDGTWQLIEEESPEGKITYGNDSLFNRTRKNNLHYQTNSLHELISDGENVYEYDLRGNRVSKKNRTDTTRYTYDPLDQLIKVKSKDNKTEFIYDPLGRRLTKIVSTKVGDHWEESGRDYYLYDGDSEIGSLKACGELDSFRVVSPDISSRTISIEAGGKVFAPITDVQRNIRRLVDIESNDVVQQYDYTAFGEKLQGKETIENPWQFASKRFDPGLTLIYFGKRDYDPAIGRWLTQDPLGFEDSFNPYQYVYNNPYRYFDPYGESVEGFLYGLGSVILGSGIILTGGMAEVATCGGYTIALGLHLQLGATLIGSGLAMTFYNLPELPLLSDLHCPTLSPQQYETHGLITLPTFDYHISLSEIRIDKKDQQEGKKKQRNARPDPDPRAEGSEHSIIEKPGPDGQYTTHHDNGRNWKQYRGSGKSHGEVARPNVKEPSVNVSPDGRIHINRPTVRPANPDEIPKRK